MAVDHWQATFDHNYLRWFDLNGQPALCEIVGVQPLVELTMRGGVKQRKPVMTLKQVQGKIENARDEYGKPLPTIKPLVMNVTNMESIAELHGTAPSAWKGKRIVLYQTETQLGKKKNEPCIRIRAPKGAE